MTALTEGKHRGEYLGPDYLPQLSFETATVKSGQDLVSGQVVEFDNGQLVACSGLTDTAGDLITAVVGILDDNIDATAGAVAGCVYLARIATVKDNVVTYPTETSDGGEKAAVVASLALLNIRPR
jgi:hypothetical protein